MIQTHLKLILISKVSFCINYALNRQTFETLGRIIQSVQVFLWQSCIFQFGPVGEILKLMNLNMLKI